MFRGSEGPLDEKLKAWVQDGVSVSPFVYQLPMLEKYNLPHFLTSYFQIQTEIEESRENH